MFAYKESTVAQIPVTEITNSTLIKPQGRIFYAGNAASFSIDYCTMYGWGGSKAMLELGDKNTLGMSLAIKNTILAKISSCICIMSFSIASTISQDCIFDS